MSQEDEWTSITIRKTRMNGILYQAAKKGGRSAGSMLDLILEKAGVPELSKQELDKKLEAIPS